MAKEKINNVTINFYRLISNSNGLKSRPFLGQIIQNNQVHMWFCVLVQSRQVHGPYCAAKPYSFSQIFQPTHSYSILHVYLILEKNPTYTTKTCRKTYFLFSTCTFIWHYTFFSFWENFHPTRLFHPTQLLGRSE